MTETKHQLGEQVTCHRCYGVYADYDANAPDSEVFVLVATKELGNEVCKILNEEDYGLSFCEGFLLRRRWFCGLATIPRPTTTRTSRGLLLSRR
jgi:hypothetical protein